MIDFSDLFCVICNVTRYLFDIVFHNVLCSLLFHVLMMISWTALFYTVTLYSVFHLKIIPSCTAFVSIRKTTTRTTFGPSWIPSSSSSSSSSSSWPTSHSSNTIFGRKYNNHHGRLVGLSMAAAANHPKFCEQCGTPTTIRIPDGDERERACCSDPICGYVSYQNPKVVVGAICFTTPTTQDESLSELKESKQIQNSIGIKSKVLLCKRAIEPCKGKWGYPQGFMELGETTREGAVRETFEEAGTIIDPKDAQLVAIYNLAGVQVQMIYCCPLQQQEETEDHDDKGGSAATTATKNDNHLDNVKMECGIESEEVKLFEWDEIPWDDLAFPTVQWALEYARSYLDNNNKDGESATTSIGNIVPQQRTKVYFDAEDKWDVLEDW